ncbi:MAG: hypothetical protein ACREMG_06180 [Gemmatimonadales bacterium]
MKTHPLKLPCFMWIGVVVVELRPPPRRAAQAGAGAQVAGAKGRELAALAETGRTPRVAQHPVRREAAAGRPWVGRPAAGVVGRILRRPVAMVVVVARATPLALVAAARTPMARRAVKAVGAAGRQTQPQAGAAGASLPSSRVVYAALMSPMRATGGTLPATHNSSLWLAARVEAVVVRMLTPRTPTAAAAEVVEAGCC